MESRRKCNSDPLSSSPAASTDFRKRTRSLNLKRVLEVTSDLDFASTDPACAPLLTSPPEQRLPDRSGAGSSSPSCVLSDLQLDKPEPCSQPLVCTTLLRCWSEIWVWRGICCLLAIAVVVLVCFKCTSPNTKCSHMEEPCPEEWIYFNKTCYYFNESEWNWNASQGHCDSHSAYLASFATETDLDFLWKICEKDCWIGLRKKAGTFQWTNGTTYHDLIEIRNNEECVYIKGKKVLSSSACNLPRTFICTMARKSP